MCHKGKRQVGGVGPNVFEKPVEEGQAGVGGGRNAPQKDVSRGMGPARGEGTTPSSQEGVPFELGKFLDKLILKKHCEQKVCSTRMHGDRENRVRKLRRLMGPYPRYEGERGDSPLGRAWVPPIRIWILFCE